MNWFDEVKADWMITRSFKSERNTSDSEGDSFRCCSRWDECRGKMAVDSGGADWLRLLLLLFLLPLVSFSFLFSASGPQDLCYQLDLESCFREAFLVTFSLFTLVSITFQTITTGILPRIPTLHLAYYLLFWPLADSSMLQIYISLIV